MRSVTKLSSDAIRVPMEGMTIRFSKVKPRIFKGWNMLLYRISVPFLRFIYYTLL